MRKLLWELLTGLHQLRVTTSEFYIGLQRQLIRALIYARVVKYSQIKSQAALLIKLTFSNSTNVGCPLVILPIVTKLVQINYFSVHSSTNQSCIFSQFYRYWISPFHRNSTRRKYLREYMTPFEALLIIWTEICGFSGKVYRNLVRISKSMTIGFSSVQETWKLIISSTFLSYLPLLTFVCRLLLILFAYIFRFRRNWASLCSPDNKWLRILSIFAEDLCLFSSRSYSSCSLSTENWWMKVIARNDYFWNAYD